MRIGEQVKFLNETGGGKIAGFKGKNIVLVEDEDGFQIPMNINEVVMVKSNDYSTAAALGKAGNKQPNAPENAMDPAGHSLKAMLREGQDEEIDMTVDDEVDLNREITFRPMPREREGGNVLTAYLAFIASTESTIDNPKFEAFLINDCNYSLRYALCTQNEDHWRLRQEGEIDPNTKISLGIFGREEINRMGRVNIKLLPFKRDTAFALKPAVDVTLRIDAVKFFRTNSFRVNAFFNESALMSTIVEGDKVERNLVIDADQIKESMYADAPARKPQGAEPATAQREALVRRYTPDQRKGGHSASPYVRPRSLDEALVVDLHAEQLLDSTKGMKSGDILEYQLKVFEDTLRQYASQRGQKIVFIHGKGEGVLRRAIINTLTRKYRQYTYQDASFQEYGYGATMVTIK